MKNELTFSSLIGTIRNIHNELVAQAGRAVNVSLTVRNWLIGCYISEYELRGADRAGYGERLLSSLLAELEKLNVSACGKRQLYQYLRFYQTYPQIGADTVRTIATPCPQGDYCCPEKSAISNRTFSDRFAKTSPSAFLLSYRAVGGNRGRYQASLL
ncbi:hypothetical protein BMS3Bbin14_02240 [bacterium BMS3Bbin14]|nr:hypothetical protein BMS3Bbin14_02240 [bacterium BMS3Bbin14]